MPLVPRFRLPARAAALLGAAAVFAAGSAPAQSPNPETMRLAFFPPIPPVFGAAINDAPTRPAYYRGRVLTAPLELAEFVNEYFYSAYGTRLQQDDGLNARMHERIRAFSRERQALLGELEGELLETELLDAASRESRLASLAARQTPRIVKLEEAAEALRDDLVRGRLLQRNVDWNDGRRWTIGVTPLPGESPREAEFQVLRAAAFYQKGLTPEQRGMLREIALELEQRARLPRRNAPPPEESDHDAAAMYFSPEMARLRLPPNLPPELLRKVGRFNSLKGTLKQELKTTLLEHDGVDAAARAERIERLAEQQWPQIGELAELAEEIRRDFAALPPPPPLAPPPRIPAELMDRIRRYERDRVANNAELNEHIMRAVRRVSYPPPHVRAESRREWLENLPRMRAEALRAATMEFQQEHRDRYDDMTARYAAIHADLTTIASLYTDPQTGRPMTATTLQRSYNSAMRRFDAFGREEVIYKTYKIAMLQPGLSPEQRRLLFGTALVGLARTLPYGEPLPTGKLPLRNM